MKRENVIETRNQFPKEVNIAEFFEKILINEKIELGLEELEKGEVVSHAEVLEHFKKKWKK